MSFSLAPRSNQKILIDPLQYLPCSTVVDYSKGKTIYCGGEASAGIYLVIDGKVKISRTADNGHEVVLDIYKADDFLVNRHS